MPEGNPAGYLRPDLFNPDPFAALGQGLPTSLGEAGRRLAAPVVNTARQASAIPPIAALNVLEGLEFGGGLARGATSALRGQGFGPGFQAGTERAREMLSAIPGVQTAREIGEGARLELNPEGSLGRDLVLGAIGPPGGGFRRGSRFFNPSGAVDTPRGSLERVVRNFRDEPVAVEIRPLREEADVTAGFELSHRMDDGELVATGALDPDEPSIVNLDVQFRPFDPNRQAESVSLTERELPLLTPITRALDEFFPGARFLSQQTPSGFQVLPTASGHRRGADIGRRLQTALNTQDEEIIRAALSGKVQEVGGSLDEVADLLKSLGPQEQEDLLVRGKLSAGSPLLAQRAQRRFNLAETLASRIPPEMNVQAQDISDFLEVLGESTPIFDEEGNLTQLFISFMDSVGR